MKCKIFYFVALVLFQALLTQAKPAPQIAVGIGSAIGGAILGWGVGKGLDTGLDAVQKSDYTYDKYMTDFRNDNFGWPRSD